MPKTLFRQIEKSQAVRTMLYGDQLASPLELQLWHTASFQRLYYLRQLGFADKVFPDAIHNRFNHVVGVCQRAEDILASAARQTEARFVPQLAATIGVRPLQQYILDRVDVARLMALLHDLSHIAFGHTLEDELDLFPTKHDALARQALMFNRITSQLLWGLYDDTIGLWPARESSTRTTERAKRMLQELLAFSNDSSAPSWLKDLPTYLTNLAGAQTALVYMHHGEKGVAQAQLALPRLLNDPEIGIDAEAFSSVNDYFLIDAIGNTICADLLDYARRDMRMANMTADYDDRLFRWFVLAQLESEDKVTRTRLAVRVFSNKFKPDILREVIRVLEIRYDLTERVLFHPAKCCAGAMLGRIVATLGLPDSIDEMLEMGDERFLEWYRLQLERLDAALAAAQSTAKEARELTSLRGTLESVDNSVRQAWTKVLSPEGKGSDEARWAGAAPAILLDSRKDVEAALALADRLRARRYYRVAFEVTETEDDMHECRVSRTYQSRIARSEAERAIERRCRLPPGTVLIHCPTRRTNFKAADVLILYAKDRPPIALRHAAETKTNVPSLQRYAKRAHDLADDYRRIWKLRVYLHQGHFLQAAVVADCALHELGASNSPYLQNVLSQETAFTEASEFLAKIGGDKGYGLVKDAAAEMLAARKGSGTRPTFRSILDRMSKQKN